MVSIPKQLKGIDPTMMEFPIDPKLIRCPSMGHSPIYLYVIRLDFLFKFCSFWDTDNGFEKIGEFILSHIFLPFLVLGNGLQDNCMGNCLFNDRGVLIMKSIKKGFDGSLH